MVQIYDNLVINHFISSLFIPDIAVMFEMLNVIKKVSDL